MKLSTIIIWVVEIEILAYYQILAWMRPESEIYLFLYTIILVLAIWANKTFKLSVGNNTLDVGG